VNKRRLAGVGHAAAPPSRGQHDDALQGDGSDQPSAVEDEHIEKEALVGAVVQG